MYISKSINNTNCKLRFFILSLFASKNILDMLEKRFHMSSLKGNQLIINKNIIYPKNTKDILTYDEMRILSNIYKHLGDANFKQLIYFDHNLGHPSYILIPLYSGIIPNAENNFYLEKVYRNMNKLKIIPLLCNCENVTTYNYKQNICPKTYE